MGYMAKYVLLIEDDPSLQKAYQIKFENKGIETRLIDSGKEVMQLLKDEQLADLPGVVVLDLLLPYISGFQVLETMRSIDKWKNIPVVIVSNLAEEDGLKKAEKLGVKHYFIKTGMKLDEAIERIVSYLQG